MKGLGASGYDVIPARNAYVAFERAIRAQPDLILLDLNTPVMDGLQVLRKLKEDPITQVIPVIALTLFPTARGEAQAVAWGASYYMAKNSETLILAIRSLLQELESREADQDASQLRSTLGLLRTGDQALDKRLGGGVSRRSLAVVEGSSATGKQSFCQRVAYRSLLDGHGVTYVATQQDVYSLLGQFASQGQDVDLYYRTGKLRIHHFKRETPIDHPSLCGVDPDRCEHPERMLLLLGAEIEQFSNPDSVVLIDSIGDLLSESRDEIIAAFFSHCKQLCDQKKRTIFLSSDFSPYSEDEEDTRVIKLAKHERGMLGVDSSTRVDAETGVVLRIAPWTKALV